MKQGLNRTDTKAKAKAMIIEGVPISTIAKELEIASSAVYRYKGEVEQEQENRAVEAVSNLDPKTVLALAERLESTSPVMAKNLVHLSEGLESLSKLEPVIHNAVGDLIVMTQEKMSHPDIKNSEFRMLGELLLKSYATLYNRPSIELNMNTQNNTVVNNAVSKRLNNLMHGLIPEQGEE